eukprot:COSAG02_NODE_24215_length_694_cov_1.611765_2_plen_81_part_00
MGHTATSGCGVAIKTCKMQRDFAQTGHAITLVDGRHRDFFMGSLLHLHRSLEKGTGAAKDANITLRAGRIRSWYNHEEEA